MRGRVEEAEQLAGPLVTSSHPLSMNGEVLKKKRKRESQGLCLAVQSRYYSMRHREKNDD